MNGNLVYKKTINFLEHFLYVLLALVLLSTLLFLIFYLLPSDPVETLVSKSSEAFHSGQITDANRRLIKEQLGLNRSASAQLKSFYSDILRGNLGVSFWTGQTVSHLIAQRFPVTLALLVPSVVLFVFLGFFWGFLQALFHGKTLGELLKLINTFLFCIPAFVIASFLARLTLNTSRDLLALTVYAATSIPTLAALVRDRMLEEETKLYVQAARGKGLSRFQILKNHLLKPCAPTVFSLLPWWWSIFFGTAVVIEPLFRISGIGMLTFEAFRNQDVPVLLGISFLFALGRVLLGLFRDLLFGDFK